MAIELDPNRTALLVVDMQYFDASRDWGEGRTARNLGVLHYFDDYFRQIDRITPIIGNLLTTFRRKSMEVMHIRVCERTADSRDVGYKQLVRGLIVPKVSKEAEFLPGLEPEGDEIIIDKSSSGVFAVTDLDRILRNIGIDTLVFAGTSTGGCVQSAVFDATDLGYRVLLVEDACADSTESSHAACVARTREQPVEVVTADALTQALGGAKDADPACKSGIERVKHYLPVSPFLPNSESETIEPYSTIFGPAITQIVTPDNVALVLVDVQRLTCDPAHRVSALIPETPDFAGFYDRVNAALDRMAELQAQCRAQGIPVIHTRTAGNLAGGRDLSPKRLGQGLRIGAGDAAAEIPPPLTLQHGEAILNKPGSSAFNGTGLDALLRNSGVDTLLLAGISVDSGLESTLRSAGDRGFGVVVAINACAAATSVTERLNASGRGTTNVRTVAEIASALKIPAVRQGASI